MGTHVIMLYRGISLSLPKHVVTFRGRSPLGKLIVCPDSDLGRAEDVIAAVFSSPMFELTLLLIYIEFFHNQPTYYPVHNTIESKSVE